MMPNTASRLDRHRVAQTWLLRGLEDLFCAFVLSTDAALERHERFSEIMGIEKCLKAVLLFQAHAEYETLDSQAAREKVTKIAQSHGHRFDRMFKELASTEIPDLAQLRQR